MLCLLGECFSLQKTTYSLLLLLLLLLLLRGILYVFDDSLLCASLSEYDSHHAHLLRYLQHFLLTASVIYSFFLFQLPVGMFVFFSFLWSQQPEVLVFAVHLAVCRFSESLLFLDFLKALFLCPWTSSLVFAVFRSFFQLEQFLPKTRFWIFRQMHSFHTGAGRVGGVSTFITTSGMACCEQKTRRARIAPCHISLVAFVHWTTE